MKSILFVLDSFDLYNVPEFQNPTFCQSYFDTENAINRNDERIITYDIGHLSFDLKDLGYDIFIGYDGKTKEFYPGMSINNGKEIRFGHNIRKLLIAGAFDDDLNINRKRNANI